MKKIAVFDLDGTLAHTAPTLALAMNIFLKEMSLPPIDAELMKTFLGNGARVLLKNVYEYLDLPREKKDIDKALEKFFVCYEQTYLEAELYDGVEETVRTLCEKGITVGVLSNKPHRFVPPLIEKLLPGLPIAFAVGQTERPRKPDPTVLLELIKNEGSDAKNCIYIGDSDVDINTSKNAGVTSCVVSWGYRPIEVLKKMNPDVIVDTTEQLCNAVRSFAQNSLKK